MADINDMSPENAALVRKIGDPVIIENLTRFPRVLDMMMGWARKETACAMADGLTRVRDFVGDEVDNRGAAGSRLTDYQKEAKDVLDDLDAVIAMAPPIGMR